MSISVEEAEGLIAALKEKELAGGCPPERWCGYENHIRGAAQVAKTIASYIPSLNPEEVYVTTLLHDICRTEESRKQRKHDILAYEKFVDRDEKMAKIILVHMFPLGIIAPYEEEGRYFFHNKKDYDFIANYLQNTKLSDFALLVQLSDALANKDGFVTIEERAQEYRERRGYDMPPVVVQSLNELKRYFDEKIGKDIYTLFGRKPIRRREFPVCSKETSYGRTF